MVTLDADYYDRWYREVIRSPARDSVVQRALGLPSEFESTGALGWEALGEVVAALDLKPTDVLLDLACGRGGYGLAIVREIGTRLIGVDFSAVAIAQARRRAEEFGLTGHAEFRVGEMTDTGLAPSSVDALLCVDSIHFADPMSAALRECRRVLKPGGRVAITAWQLVDSTDEELRRRMRHRDLAVELKAAGFAQVSVIEKPAWRAAERAMWLEVAGMCVGDDPALRTMQDEARRVLSVFDLRQRVLATATAPE